MNTISKPTLKVHIHGQYRCADPVLCVQAHRQELLAHLQESLVRAAAIQCPNARCVNDACMHHESMICLTGHVHCMIYIERQSPACLLNHWQPEASILYAYTLGRLMQQSSTDCNMCTFRSSTTSPTSYRIQASSTPSSASRLILSYPVQHLSL